MTPKILNRDDILGANDLQRDRVRVPEWSGEIYVRTLSLEERLQFEAQITDARDSAAGAHRVLVLVAATACDETGTLLFSFEDVASLRKKSWNAVQRVFRAAVKLNAMQRGLDDADGMEAQ